MKSNRLSNIIVLTTLLIIALVSFTCEKNPARSKLGADFEVKDIASIWVSLKIPIPDSISTNTFEIVRNDSIIGNYTCNDDDTLIIDEGLTPDTDYNYSVRFIKKGKTRAMSDIIPVHTLATTSHDFIWEVDTLGTYGSFLNDVQIVDENNIWVVGNIETDSCEYNAAHWNGEEWELMGIYSNTLDLYSIHYFSDDDIWVTSYGLPYHWDGEEWTRYHIQNMGLDATAGFDCWGTSSSNMYFVGLEGSLVHYNGTKFTQINTRTDVNLKDIDATEDGKYIFISGYNHELPSKSTALQIINDRLMQLYYIDGLYQDETYGYIGAVSVKDHFVFFATPAGIWRYDFLYKNSIIMNIDNVECGKLIVADYNDIIGYRGGMGFVHYNGKDWRIERYCENYYNFSFSGGDYKDGLAAMVGCTLSVRGIILRGQHQ